MKNTVKKILTSAIVMSILSGCTAFQYREYEKESQQAGDRIESTRHSYSYKKVKELEHPPIAPKKLEDIVIIDWLDNHVDQKSQELPLSIILKQVMAGTGVKIDYDYDIDPNVPITVNFEGTIEEALKMVSLQGNVFIKKSPNKIIVQKYVVKTFAIPAIAGNSSYQIGSSSGGSSGSNEDAQSGSVVSTGSGDGQFANYALQDSNSTTEIYEAIRSIIAVPGEKEQLYGSVQQLQGMSAIVVRTTPSLMEQVESFMSDAIARLSAEVVLDVEVVEWIKNDGSEFGLDGLLEVNTGIGDLSFSGESTQITDSGDTGFAWTGSGDYSGTDALIRYLRQHGEVSITTKQTVKALNQQAQEVDLSDVRSYISELSVSYDDDDDATVDIENSTVRDGVKMIVVPSIYKDHVFLRLNGTLVKFISFDTQEISDVTISNPRTRQSRFNVSGKFEYNKPVLLTSMKQVVTQSETNKTAEIMSSNSGEKKVVDTLVLVTPYLRMEKSK